MRNIWIICVFMCAVAARSQALLDMPLEERAVMLCKSFETLHHNKGEYIGYGHRIQPGEPYKPNQELSEKHADLLLRTDLAKLRIMFSSYGSDAVLLSALAYNVGAYTLLGYGDNPKSQLLQALDKGNRDIEQLYLQYCHYNGKEHHMLLIRRMAELRLLYTKNPK